MKYFILLIGVVIFSTDCFAKTTEIIGGNYTIEDIYRKLNTPFLESKQGLSGMKNKDLTKEDFHSFFKEKNGGKALELGQKFLGDNEYLLENGNCGIRFFRDNQNIIQIVCLYYKVASPNPKWLVEILNQGTDRVVMDKLTESGGYIVFSYEDRDIDTQYRHQYLLAGRDKSQYFYARITKSIINKNARKSYDKGIKSGPSIWKKYGT